MKNYFDKETDKYIVEYIEEDDVKKKQKIFTDHIFPAFQKLVENIIYVYGFFTIDDVELLKQDALSNLYEHIHKFDKTRGTKGFSYFDVIAKNWFFQKTRELSKRRQNESEYSSIDSDTAISEENFADKSNNNEEEFLRKDFWFEFYNAFDSWKPKLKKQERLILETIIFLFKKPEQIQVFNKKAIFMYIREITDLNNKQVTSKLKKIRSVYNEWKAEYTKKLDKI